MHHPKHPILGLHGCDEPALKGQFIWSVVYFFFSPFFSPQTIFFGSSLFFFPGSFWFFFFSSHHPNHHFLLGNSYLPPFLLPAHLLTYLYWTSPSTSLILLTLCLCLCSPPSPTFEIQWDQSLGLQSFKRAGRNKQASLEHPGVRSLFGAWNKCEEQ